MDADARAGSARAGARGDATGQASTTSGATAPRPPKAQSPEAGSTGGATSGATRPGPEGDTPVEPLELPRPAAPRVDDLDTGTPEAAAATSPLSPLLGYWRQLDDGRREADFAPGGHDVGLLAIRPTQRSMQVYRSWGDPPRLVVAAELRATFGLEGDVRLEETPSRPSRFLSEPLTLPGTPTRTATPPSRTLPCDTRWAIGTDGVLTLDGRHYQRIDRETFERAGAARAAAPVTATTASAKTAGSSRSQEPAGGVDFFGARVRGGYVCFVCDISGSMTGDKMEALRKEIVRTAGALPAGTNWQVVFFDDSAHLFQKGWVRAGTPESDALLRKVDGVGTGGGTDPEGALTYAFTQLDPIPHELFLLTDGHFGSDAAMTLRQLNGGADRTRIHTLAMGDDADVATLQAIAQAHGGTFTHIPAQAPQLPIGPGPPRGRGTPPP